VIFDTSTTTARVQLALVFFIAFVITLCSSETVYKKSPTKTFIAGLIPQGWSFFTKDPREENLDVYGLEENGLKKYTLTNQSVRSYFGLSRNNRRLSFEASLLSATVTEWRDTTIAQIDDTTLKGLMNQRISTNHYQEVTAPHNVQHYAPGFYLLLLYKPIPYLYYKSEVGTYSRDIKYCIISVQ